MLIQDLQANCLGPPVLVGSTIARMQIRAFDFATRDYSFDLFSTRMKLTMIILPSRFDVMPSAAFGHDCFPFSFAAQFFLSSLRILQSTERYSIEKVLVFRTI